MKTAGIEDHGRVAVPRPNFLTMNKLARNPLVHLTLIALAICLAYAQEARKTALRGRGYSVASSTGPGARGR